MSTSVLNFLRFVVVEEYVDVIFRGLLDNFSLGLKESFSSPIQGGDAVCLLLFGD